MTGLLKSTLETGFISLGIITLSNAIMNPTIGDRGFLLGALLLCIGVIIDFFGDVYKMRLKDEELKHTEARAEEIAEEKAEEKAKEIAQKLVKKELNELEDTLCNDPESLCNKEEG